MFVVFFARSPTPTGNYPKSRLDHTWPSTEKLATPSTEERINCGAFITGFVSCSENVQTATATQMNVTDITLTETPVNQECLRHGAVSVT